MNMDARNQYLKVLQDRYFKARSKKEKSLILDEYCKNTGQNRKYVIRKINSPFFSRPKKKRIRKRIYDGYVRAALVDVWKIFDNPCGQRLEPLLKTEIDRLREFGELLIPDEAKDKLKRISPKTIDRALKRQREYLHLNRKYQRRKNPLIYQKIPVKAGGWDRNLPGQVQVDLVEHCGQSSSGHYGNSISFCCVAFGWWEAEAVLGKGQELLFNAITSVRKRFPFEWKELHPDNDTPFINWHLLRYCEREGILLSRSRPYRKNDNSFVEQKNSTHIRNVIGHLRYDTEKEIEIINDLYRNELRLYKNFFQPVMKLKEKTREKGKIHRRYDTPKTPYQRLMESPYIPDETKSRLKAIYLSLNPAQLKRNIEKKLNKLYRVYQEKNNSQGACPFKKQIPRSVTSYVTQQELIGLHS